MCDDATEGENEAYLRSRQLSRREVGVGAGAAFALMVTGCAPPPAPAQEPASTLTPAPPPPTAATAESAPREPAALPAVVGRMVVIEMPEGSAEAFFVAPEGGAH